MGLFSSEQETHSKVNAPKWYRRDLKDLSARAKDISLEDFEGFGQDRYVGFTGDELSSFDMIRNLAGSPADFSESMGLARTAAGGIAPPTSQGLSDYMNPYTRDVVDYQTELMNQGLDQRLAGLNAGFSGAYGGSRHGLAEGNMTAQGLRDIAGMQSGLLSQGFDNAMGNYLNTARYNSDAAARGAGQLSDLTNINRAGMVDNANMLGRIGTQQRELGQAERDFGYQEHLMDQNWETDRLNNYANTLYNYPTQLFSRTTTSKSSPSKMAAAIGTASSLMGLGSQAMGMMSGGNEGAPGGTAAPTGGAAGFKDGGLVKKYSDGGLVTGLMKLAPMLQDEEKDKKKPEDTIAANMAMIGGKPANHLQHLANGGLVNSMTDEEALALAKMPAGEPNRTDIINNEIQNMLATGMTENQISDALVNYEAEQLGENRTSLGPLDNYPLLGGITSAMVEAKKPKREMAGSIDFLRQIANPEEPVQDETPEPLRIAQKAQRSGIKLPGLEQSERVPAFEKYNPPNERTPKRSFGDTLLEFGLRTLANSGAPNAFEAIGKAGLGTLQSNRANAAQRRSESLGAYDKAYDAGVSGRKERSSEQYMRDLATQQVRSSRMKQEKLANDLEIAKLKASKKGKSIQETIAVEIAKSLMAQGVEPQEAMAQALSSLGSSGSSRVPGGMPVHRIPAR